MKIKSTATTETDSDVDQEVLVSKCRVYKTVWVAGRIYLWNWNDCPGCICGFFGLVVCLGTTKSSLQPLTHIHTHNILSNFALN